MSPSPAIPLARTVLLLAALVAASAHSAQAQIPSGSPSVRADSLGTVTVRILRDSIPVEAVLVRSERAGGQTDGLGRVVLRLPSGERQLIAQKIGFKPETLTVTVRAGTETAATMRLTEQATELESVVVAATRSGRRIEDEPVRVEVLAREEIEEKLLMTPGDITMMLNETSGLRVQTTSPSLGGANVRIQGLRGRYTQILSDGLPLYGQTGGLGLLQIPPMDLAQVEVIKGAASALYGSQALGGVINLVSRRPDNEAERELLLNQTTRGGTDGVLWLSKMLTERWGYTFLGGAHWQSRHDVDDDGWSDLPGYQRAVLRPRLLWSTKQGRSIFLTGGATLEERDGGTLPGRAAPSGEPFTEELDTRRLDIGGVGRFLVRSGSLLSVRSSAMEQHHRHQFGEVIEEDRHRTWFAEAALSVPRGPATWIVGAAFQHEDYHSEDILSFDYSYTVPSVFAQADIDPAPWVSLSVSARLDAHSEYGAFINPRVSSLLRAPAQGPLAGWTARISIGTGAFTPTPFTEETETTGLGALEPLSDIGAERAASASFDVGGALGALEVNGTLFGSVVLDPLTTLAVPSNASVGPSRIRLLNSTEPTRTYGSELLARWRRESAVVTATYTFVRSTELDPDGARRRDVALTPRHAIGVVGVIEREGRGRVGLELYYTGRQSLDENPFRNVSRPYVILGLLAERRIRRARLFVNAENLGDVRQTRYDPLVRPSRGRGGRWTTDVWTELAGRTINGGVRLDF